MKKTYSDKLKDPRWQKKRLLILDRDDYTCCRCSDSSTELHVHHLQYNNEPWDADDDFLETLCKHCHFVVSKHKDKTFSEGFKDGDLLILFTTDGWFYFFDISSSEPVLKSKVMRSHFIKFRPFDFK
jgi:hypothetical protein